MVIREWRGRTARSMADAYPTHFRERVVGELRRVPGFVGAYLCQDQVGEMIEFLVISQWHSMEAIRAFAGADVERAVVEPGAVAALSGYDASVRHYEVIEQVSMLPWP